MMVQDQLVFEEEFDENHAFTDEEVIEYAITIGIDPENEPELLFIAREGVATPLPKDWKPCQDPSQEDVFYYFNFKTGESIWDHPCDQYYKNMVREEREKRKATSKEKKEGGKKEGKKSSGKDGKKGKKKGSGEEANGGGTGGGSVISSLPPPTFAPGLGSPTNLGPLKPLKSLSPQLSPLGKPSFVKDPLQRDSLGIGSVLGSSRGIGSSDATNPRSDSSSGEGDLGIFGGEKIELMQSEDEDENEEESFDLGASTTRDDDVNKPSISDLQPRLKSALSSPAASNGRIKPTAVRFNVDPDLNSTNKSMFEYQESDEDGNDDDDDEKDDDDDEEDQDDDDGDDDDNEEIDFGIPTSKETKELLRDPEELLLMSPSSRLKQLEDMEKEIARPDTASTTTTPATSTDGPLGLFPLTPLGKDKLKSSGLAPLAPLGSLSRSPLPSSGLAPLTLPAPSRPTSFSLKNDENEDFEEKISPTAKEIVKKKLSVDKKETNSPEKSKVGPEKKAKGDSNSIPVIKASLNNSLPTEDDGERRNGEEEWRKKMNKEFDDVKLELMEEKEEKLKDLRKRLERESEEEEDRLREENDKKIGRIKEEMEEKYDKERKRIADDNEKELGRARRELEEEKERRLAEMREELEREMADDERKTDIKRAEEVRRKGVDQEVEEEFSRWEKEKKEKTEARKKDIEEELAREEKEAEAKREEMRRSFEDDMEKLKKDLEERRKALEKEVDEEKKKKEEENQKDIEALRKTLDNKKKIMEEKHEKEIKFLKGGFETKMAELTEQYAAVEEERRRSLKEENERKVENIRKEREEEARLRVEEIEAEFRVAVEKKRAEVVAEKRELDEEKEKVETEMKRLADEQEGVVRKRQECEEKMMNRGRSGASKNNDEDDVEVLETEREKFAVEEFNLKARDSEKVQSSAVEAGVGAAKSAKTRPKEKFRPPPTIDASAVGDVDHGDALTRAREFLKKQRESLEQQWRLRDKAMEKELRVQKERIIRPILGEAARNSRRGAKSGVKGAQASKRGAYKQSRGASPEESESPTPASPRPSPSEDSVEDASSGVSSSDLTFLDDTADDDDSRAVGGRYGWTYLGSRPFSAKSSPSPAPGSSVYAERLLHQVHRDMAAINSMLALVAPGTADGLQAKSTPKLTRSQSFTSLHQSIYPTPSTLAPAPLVQSFLSPSSQLPNKPLTASTISLPRPGFYDKPSLDNWRRYYGPETTGHSFGQIESVPSLRTSRYQPTHAITRQFATSTPRNGPPEVGRGLPTPHRFSQFSTSQSSLSSNKSVREQLEETKEWLRRHSNPVATAPSAAVVGGGVQHPPQFIPTPSIIKR